MDFENKLALNTGIYTAKDISKILRISVSKVNRWIKSYWDDRFAKEFKKTYSWKVSDTRAIGFHTLIEVYILTLFADAGVSTKEVLKAHDELSKLYQTPFPFARKDILENIKTDGKKIFIKITEDNILSLDGKKQFQIEFIKLFFKNLVFDYNLLANKFYPLGKDKDIVVDPTRQFGHPVIGQTNIFPESIYNMYKAGEPKKFIAFTYEISEREVQSAIEYCKVA